ncbi:DUF6682 family protein [Alicycliphilus denitrificans]|uniref:phage adaptor protein n=1 Tax=Alicycliphilus denitrificans TaxID=179636 RepID=UPI0001DA01FE|nr:DUF6682 family protein [Alicycliphilus denitrificans]ADU99438.1 hypothetical protein Alide_1683 [Alicycliphilus denitrificans BC]
MNLEQLVERFRIDADDLVEPYLWQPEWVVGWLNEAQDEAAVRARLLLDDYTPGLCEIAVEEGRGSYPLHSKTYEIAHLQFESTGRPCELDMVSREKLDRIEPRWRQLAADAPRWAIQTDTRLRLVPAPREAGLLRLEAYRLPMRALAQDRDKPEIHEAHHLHLVQWALYRAFSKPDTEVIDPTRAAQALDNFERYFGLRPDADLRRSTRQDEVQANVSHIL